MKAYLTTDPNQRLSKIALSLLLVLALLAAMLPLPTLAAANTATCSKNYTVKSGDTISSIAAANDITVTELAAANNLKEPYTIYVDQVLCIPGTAATTTTSTSTTASSGSGKKMTLERGETTLKVTLSGYPKNGHYLIRGRIYDRNDSSWYRFGRFKTTKNGSVTITLKLPRILRDAELIQICVKNVVTDSVDCKKLPLITP
jgi:murein DD-endopeptidase MepM/ murein hydrolase activator NlpD